MIDLHIDPIQVNIGGTWPLTFDPKTHTYFDEKGIIPGVSELMKAAGLSMRYGPGASKSRDIGIEAHAATAKLDVTGYGPEAITCPEVAGHLEGWKSWKDFRKPNFLAVERIVGHKKWRYAGTADRFIRTLAGIIVVDLKTGSPSKFYDYQLAAYAMAYEEEMGEPVIGGLLVYTKPNGRFTTDEVDKTRWKQARLTWTSAMRNHQEYAA